MATPMMDIGRIAGGYLWSRYGKRKRKLPKDRGIVNPSNTNSIGKAQYNAFMKANPPINLLKELRDNFKGTAESQRAAQRLRQSSTRTEQEYERKRKKSTEMPKNYGTLGRRFKGKYKTRAISPLTSRLRYVQHDEVKYNTCVYTGFNDVGPLTHLLTSACEAMLLYYTNKVGDNRRNYQVTSMHDELSFPANNPIWNVMYFNFRKAPQYNADLDILDVKIGNGYTNGVQLTTPIQKTFDQIVQDMVSTFWDRIQKGYELFSVSIYRDENPIFYDAAAGRHQLKLMARAKYKLQNTTDADGGTDGVHDKTNIHANPLDGLVYRFRNRVPRFQAGLTATMAGGDAYTNDIETIDPPGRFAGVRTVDLRLAAPKTFDVPPAAPYTVWSNSTGRAKILIKPGEHRILSLKESFKGSFNSFAKKYFPVTMDTNQRYSVPPGGNCLLIALKPTFRNVTDAEVEVQTEIDRYYESKFVSTRLTAKPITTILS